MTEMALAPAEAVLVQIEAAWRALADVNTVQDAVRVARGGDVLREAVKNAKLGPRMQYEAGVFKVESTAKAGEMLAAPDSRQERGRPTGKTLDDQRFLPTLADLGVSEFESYYWRKIARIPPEKRLAYFKLVERVIEGVEAGEQDPSASKVWEVTTAGVLRYWQTDVHKSSEEDEWLTPPDIIARTLHVLGEIDLDPCSNTFGGPNVPAAVRYVEGDDGLGRTWRGRVYMNPPYGATIAAWTAKLRSEYAAGNVTEAIALVPARTDTEWWGSLRDTAICFVRRRLKFSGAANSAPFPSAVAYFGGRREGFAEAFGEVGDIWARLEV